MATGSNFLVQSLQTHRLGAGFQRALERHAVANGQLSPANNRSSSCGRNLQLSAPGVGPFARQRRRSAGNVASRAAGQSALKRVRGGPDTTTNSCAAPRSCRYKALSRRWHSSCGAAGDCARDFGDALRLFRTCNQQGGTLLCACAHGRSVRVLE